MHVETAHGVRYKPHDRFLIVAVTATIEAGSARAIETRAAEVVTAMTVAIEAGVVMTRIMMPVIIEHRRMVCRRIGGGW